MKHRLGAPPRCALHGKEVIYWHEKPREMRNSKNEDAVITLVARRSPALARSLAPSGAHPPTFRLPHQNLKNSKQYTFPQTSTTTELFKLKNETLTPN